MASLNPFKRSRRRSEEPVDPTPVVLSAEERAAEEVAHIEAQIAAARRDESRAEAEADQREKQRQLHRSFVEATEKRKRLEQLLAAVRKRQKLGRLKFYHADIARTAMQLMAALRTAAELNTAAVNALSRARSALGDELAMEYLKPVVFNGLVREDLVANWGNEIIRQLNGTDKKLADVTSQEPPAPRLIAPVAAGQIPKIEHVSPPLTQAPAAAAGVTQVPVATEEAPLAEGQVRVRVLLDGWPPADDLPACRAGDRVVLPRKHAEYVAMRGIVEIIEVFVSAALASAGEPNEGAAKQ